MITPNMFVPLHNSPNLHVKNMIQQELEKQDTEGIITTVPILETELPVGKNIRYVYSEY